jgi:DNA processing protein
MAMIDEKAYWVAWSRVPGIGPARMRMVLAACGSLQAAWGARTIDLRAAGLDERTATSATKAFASIDPAREWERIERAGITVLTWTDDEYPERLRSIASAPAILYLRGTLAPDDALAVAIVGTRRMTAYGREVTYRIATGLASLGITVVSGLALGVDGAAHRAVLEAGGRTLAVLGHGLHTLSPASHRDLAARIGAGGGALISEYPLDAPAEPANFPARNRIISGLSLGVVIIEAGEKSGALITADFAADQGREVFAVPGSVLSPMSAGCNALIKDGARLVTGVDDILAELRLDIRREQQATQQALPTLPGVPGADALLGALGAEPCHIDDLCRACGLPISDVNGLLVQLQLTGAVRPAGPQLYVRA